VVDAVGLDEAVDGYLDHVATERGLARKTVEAYARDLAFFTRFAVARRIRTAGRIGTADVRAHLAALAERGLSARSQARALATVRGFLRFLAAEGVLTDDPARTIHVRRPPARLPRALGTAEVGTLLAQPWQVHADFIQALAQLAGARESFAKLAKAKLILGNDNHIGEIGEYWVRRYYELRGQFKCYGTGKLPQNAVT